MAEFTFDSQRPDENVILVLRRHPWVLAKPGFIFLALLVIFIVLFIFFGFSKVTSFYIFATLFLGVLFWFVLQYPSFLTIHGFICAMILMRGSTRCSYANRKESSIRCI